MSMLARRKGKPKPDTKPALNVVFDSGAYSAFKRGMPIGLDDYCNFLAGNRDWISHYVNMDVINPKSAEEAAKASYENFLYMRSKGLEPLPVYHAMESIDWLKRYIDLGCQYVGISASVLSHHNREADDWYAKVWPYLVNKEGLPIVKTHGFGEGRYKAMIRSPWFSVDSTTWLYTAQRTGSLAIPGSNKRLSFRTDEKGTSGTDIDHLSGEDNLLLERLLAKYNMSSEALRRRNTLHSTMVRTYLTCHNYLDRVERAIKHCPVKIKQTGLLSRQFYPDWPSIHIPAPSLYLVSAVNNAMGMVALAHAKAPNVLVSFFYTRSKVHAEKMRSFAYDPLQTVATDEIFKRYNNIFKECLTS